MRRLVSSIPGENRYSGRSQGNNLVSIVLSIENPKTAHILGDAIDFDIQSNKRKKKIIN